VIINVLVLSSIVKSIIFQYKREPRAAKTAKTAEIVLKCKRKQERQKKKEIG
jgi:hypothetical protein